MLCLSTFHNLALYLLLWVSVLVLFWVLFSSLTYWSQHFFLFINILKEHNNTSLRVFKLVLSPSWSAILHAFVQRSDVGAYCVGRVNGLAVVAGYPWVSLLRTTRHAPPLDAYASLVLRRIFCPFGNATSPSLRDTSGNVTSWRLTIFFVFTFVATRNRIDSSTRRRLFLSDW